MEYVSLGLLTLAACYPLALLGVLFKTMRAETKHRKAYDAAFEATFKNARAYTHSHRFAFVEYPYKAVDKWCDDARNAFFGPLMVTPFSIAVLWRPIYTEEQLAAFSEPLSFETQEWPEVI